jgi:hypothetical protein
MFKGTETTRVTSSAPEDQVYAKIEEGLKDLGTVKVSKSGAITIDANKNLSNVVTDVALSGQVQKEAGGEYAVTVNYDCSPSMINWLITVGLGILTCGPGLLFFLVSILGKGGASTAVQNAFNTMKSKVK